MSKSKRLSQIKSSYTPKPQTFQEKKWVNNKKFVFRENMANVSPMKALAIISVILVGEAARIAATSAQNPSKDNRNAKQQPHTGKEAKTKSMANICHRLNESNFKLQAKSPLLLPRENSDARSIFFSKHVRSAVHPGLYMLPNGLASVEAWQTAQRDVLTQYVKNNPEITLDHAQNVLIRLIAKDLRKTFEIDQSYKESGPADRLCFDQALDWVEQKLLFRPFEDFPNRTQLLILQKLNYLLSAPDERNHIDSNLEISLLRTKPIFVRSKREVPNLHEAYEWEAFLQNSPHELFLYRKFIKAYEELYEKHPEVFPLNIEKFYNFLDKQDKRISPFIKKYFYFAPNPEEIPQLFENFLKTLNDKMHNLKKSVVVEDAIAVAAYAHMEFIAIHPFVDANGRTARTLMNLILMQYKLPPVAILRNIEYSKIIAKAINEKNYKIFEDYLRQEVSKTLKESANHDKLVNEMESCVKQNGDCQPILNSYMQKFSDKQKLSEKNSQASESAATISNSKTNSKPTPVKLPKGTPTDAQRKAARKREIRKRK